MRAAVLVLALALALGGCSTLRAQWDASSTAERATLVGLIAVTVWIAGGASGARPGAAAVSRCASGQPISCPPEASGGETCVCL